MFTRDEDMGIRLEIVNRDNIEKLLYDEDLDVDIQDRSHFI